MTDTGIQTAGDGIDWSYLNTGRNQDNVLSTLMKEAIKKDETEDSKINNFDNLPYYVKAFNIFSKDNKYKFTFSEIIEQKIETSEIITSKKGKKEKEKKLSKKELIIQENKDEIRKKDINNFLSSLTISNHLPYTNKDPLTAFFNIINWSLYLITNKKKDIDLLIYLNCALSLYKSINDSAYFLNPIIIQETNIILNNIEEIINKKFKNTEDKCIFLLKNQPLLLECFWDKTKPKAIALYPEQVSIISLIIENLNEKNLIFFEMPPANGKTQLAVIIAKLISFKNIENIRNIPNYKRKTLLYICYNTIVRNEVAKLCLTQTIDVKFWLAVTQMDKIDSKIKTYLRPYKNCFPDWRQKNMRSKKQEEAYLENRKKKYSEDIREQWEFSIEDTKPISEQYFRKESSENLYPDRDYSNPENIPEMIIADLESALELLKAYPDLFITYFDEAFALANSPITAEVMNQMGFTVLVSATLSRPDEIPTVISEFKRRHNHETNDFLHIIKSSRQHISCTFIDESGNIFAPHHSINTIEDMEYFISKIDTPLIKRGYSPEVVIDMIIKINKYLPENLKFDNVFLKYGMLTHESIRDYACSIMAYIYESNNIDLFNLLKSNIIQKISNMDLNTIFTTSSINYQFGNTLHLSILNNFNNHVNSISSPLLNGSPKINDIINEYKKVYDSIVSQIQSFEKSHSDETDELIADLTKTLGNLKINFPGEFIINSRRHSIRFNNSRDLINENLPANLTIDEMNILDDNRTKLLFSNVGIYQPENFSNQEMDLFLRNKDNFKFIISTPSIVYGTNIGLNIIDINESFKDYCSKNTLYQLIGRAGRRGKSDSAMIIFRDNSMLNTIFKIEEGNIESEMIESNFNKIISI